MFFLLEILDTLFLLQLDSSLIALSQQYLIPLVGLEGGDALPLFLVKLDSLIAMEYIGPGVTTLFNNQVLVEIPVGCSWDDEVEAAHFTPTRKTDH